jgi:DDE family transposase
MLYSVPLRGAGWIVEDVQHEAGLIGEFLQLELPKSDARAIRAAAVGGDRQLAGLGIALASHANEPLKLGFSRQSNRKADEGSKHPDRNAQFEHINAKVIAAQAKGQPVISVDTKKKELIGNFRNGGTDYRPKGDPLRVKVHDFEDKKLGKVVPYGVYDVTANAGFVSVGITSDTAEFAVQSIRPPAPCAPCRR